MHSVTIRLLNGLRNVLLFIMVMITLCEIINCEFEGSCHNYKAVFPEIPFNQCVIDETKADTLFACLNKMKTINASAFSFNQNKSPVHRLL